VAGDPRVARRTALWQLGVAAPAAPSGAHGTQLALALGLPAAPELRPLADWDALVADYTTTGMTVHRHPLELLRPALAARGTVTSADLQRLPHGSAVRIGGLVMARQRPATANGVCFLLLEDEHGTVNLVVLPPVYRRDRLAVRTEPLVVAEGTLERHASAGGAVNVVVRRLRALETPDRPLAEVHELRAPEAAPAAAEEPLAAAGGAAFRAVAPPVQSFTQGRRR
jgi:error-prone DNA polymerase